MSFIYPEMTVGDRVILHSGVVIGADGFGYAREPVPGSPPDEPVRHRKIRQVGRVVIADDVEIGANTTIDRATLTARRVGRGTKIDNLVPSATTPRSAGTASSSGKPVCRARRRSTTT